MNVKSQRAVPGYAQPGYPPPSYSQQSGYAGWYPQQPGYPRGYPQQPGYPGGYPKQPGYPNQSSAGGYPPPGYPGGGYPSGQYLAPEAQRTILQPPARREDLEYGDDDDGVFNFTDKSVRMAFIRKVYTILVIQLAVTVAIVSLFVLHEEVKHWVKARPALFWVALAITFVTMLAISCCQSVARSFPMNVICLSIFTLAEGFLLGVMCIRFKTDAVLYAAATTLVVTLVLTIFATQTSIDFTVCNGILLVALVILFIFGIFIMFFPSKLLILIYSSLGAFLFSIFIVVDTQELVGGRQNELSPEDYIFGALKLYLDIINLFVNLLHLFGLLGSDE